MNDKTILQLLRENREVTDMAIEATQTAIEKTKMTLTVLEEVLDRLTQGRGSNDQIAVNMGFIPTQEPVLPQRQRPQASLTSPQKMISLW